MERDPADEHLIQEPVPLRSDDQQGRARILHRSQNETRSHGLGARRRASRDPSRLTVERSPPSALLHGGLPRPRSSRPGTATASPFQPSPPHRPCMPCTRQPMPVPLAPTRATCPSTGWRSRVVGREKGANRGLGRAVGLRHEDRLLGRDGQPLVYASKEHPGGQPAGRRADRDEIDPLPVRDLADAALGMPSSIKEALSLPADRIKASALATAAVPASRRWVIKVAAT